MKRCAAFIGQLCTRGLKKKHSDTIQGCSTRNNIVSSKVADVNYEEVFMMLFKLSNSFALNLGTTGRRNLMLLNKNFYKTVKPFQYGKDQNCHKQNAEFFCSKFENPLRNKTEGFVIIRSAPQLFLLYASVEMIVNMSEATYAPTMLELWKNIPAKCEYHHRLTNAVGFLQRQKNLGEETYCPRIVTKVEFISPGYFQFSYFDPHHTSLIEKVVF